MKIQSLAVIFVIIILPISLMLSTYTKTRVETINIQAEYDSKLNDATFDAIKAYQINSFSNITGSYTNSKIRDIKASVNTFFTSMATNFTTLGYTKETLQNYVPALVYTMYDGYYIYTPFQNTWNTNSSNQDIKTEMDKQITGQNTYSDGEKLFGLKPYVYYSCRYKKGSIDVVITYSLDNYIQIQGTINGKTVSRYGYLLDNININGNIVTYNGIQIGETTELREDVYADGAYQGNLLYIKKDGTKYYLSSDERTVFTILNDKIIKQSGITASDIKNNQNAIEYYKQANSLYTFMENNGLLELTTDDIVNLETGNKYQAGEENPYYSISGKIFDFGNIESETSNFNTHRIDVIKNSITRNLAIAINNFNNYYAEMSFNFEMPQLTDEDWDKIMNNISIISFMQGVNIGGKIYNGYSIITNTKNEDVVMEDSIYIKTNDGVLHDIRENNLANQKLVVGVYNVNTEKRTATVDGLTKYYMPVNGTFSYDSIITKNNVYDLRNNNMTLATYVKSLPNNLKQIYYTAIARERYGLYRQQLEI